MEPPTKLMSENTSESIASDFEYAYYQYLRSHESGSLMISCGEKALDSGAYGRGIALLAGGEGEDTPTLISAFKHAASECGVGLPSPVGERVWLAKKTVELVTSKGLVLDPAEEFERNLDFVAVVMRKWDNSAATDLADHLWNRADMEWLRWSRQLDKRRDAAINSSISSGMKRIVEEVIDTLNWVAYGGIGNEHVEAIRKITSSLQDVG